jgi:2-keto-3-deoxy-L-rhamnonate aldolase RhmA
MDGFKQRLRAGQTVTLVNPDHASAGLVAFVAQLGVEAFMLDCEQGTPDFEDVEQMTRAARLHGAAALVRIPSPEPWTIERYVMRGVDGLVIPRLDTAAQLRRAVDDIRYAAAKGFHRQVIVVQVESASALRELDGFLAVPEVDCYFIGAVDLAKSMGHAGDYTQPEVMQALQQTVRRIRDAGRSVGFLVKPEDVRAWQAQGVTLLYTHVNDFIRQGWGSWRERVECRTTR